MPATLSKRLPGSAAAAAARPDMAQAGGKDASKLGEALETAWGVIETQVK